MSSLLLQASQTKPPYCAGLVCTCGNDCHNNADYHSEVVDRLNTIDSNASDIVSSFISVSTDDDEDDVWGW